MAGKTLWSWLVRSDAKTEIYLPPELNLMVSISEFADALKAQVEANHLPVELELQDVEWDSSGTKQTRVLIRHNDPRMNIVSFLTGLDRFGDFYYVEEKLYWEPPQLLSPPQKRVSTRPTRGCIGPSLMILGGIFGVLGLIPGGAEVPLHFLLVGAGLLLLGIVVRQHDGPEYEAELKLYEQTRASDTIVEEWIKQIEEADHKSRTDDEFGRFYLAVRSTIRQTIQKLFIDRHAELRERKEKELSRQELEAELEKRKGEGFK